jgi:NUMOD3 motif
VRAARLVRRHGHVRRSDLVADGAARQSQAGPGLRPARRRSLEAVRQESEVAVAHWWGVSLDVAWKMRKALAVPEFNEGTRRLKGEVAREPASIEARAEGCRRVGPDPERRARIAAAKRGKPRPAHVVEAIIAAHKGTRHTDEARAKMSAAQRRRGARPPKAGRSWTPEEDELLRTLRPVEVAARTGRTLTAVYGRRIVLGMPDGRAGRTIPKQDQQM